MPSAGSVALPFVIALAVSVNLAGVALSRWRLAAAVTLAQVAFHTAFAWGAGGATTTMPATAGAGPHAGHDAASLTVTVDAAASAAHATHLSPGMIAAHVAAAVATYALLRHGELLLEAARAWAASLVSRLRVPRASLPLATRASAPQRRPVVVVSHTPASAHGVRGPPLSLA